MESLRNLKVHPPEASGEYGNGDGYGNGDWYGNGH